MQDLPIGITEFAEIRQKRCVYVDKTKHIYSLLQDNQRTFLSRPRGFGKSLLISTLEAALQGKKELFEGLWIHTSDYEFPLYGVIRLDFSMLAIESAARLIVSLKHILMVTGKKHSILLDEQLPLNTLFGELISSLSKALGNAPIAILIDEYDYAIMRTLHKLELAKEIRDILRSFSSVIKAESALVQFVFITSVRAFSKAGLSSGLNNLKNLTMNQEFSDICGYTDEEVDFYFKEHIQAWSKQKELSYNCLREDLRNWYYGYCFEEEGTTVYNPFSLTFALQAEEIRNFWFGSGVSRFLLDEFYKAERQEECKLLELDQIKGAGDLLQTFEIESLPLPSLLFQMGYLTIGSYDPMRGNYSLKYPNREIRASLNRHLFTIVTKQPIAKTNPVIGELYAALLKEDMEELVRCLSTLLSHIPYLLHMEEERYYHSLLQTIFYASGIDAQSERLTNSGRMDLILELPKLLYIVELKIGKSAKEALRQIETKKYYEPFLSKNKPILCVGLSFSRKKNPSVTYALKKLSPKPS